MNFSTVNKNINNPNYEYVNFINKNEKNLNKQLYFNTQNNLFYQIKKGKFENKNKNHKKKNLMKFEQRKLEKENLENLNNLILKDSTQKILK